MISVIRNYFAWLFVLALLTGCSGKKDDALKEKDSKVTDKKDGEPSGKADFSMTAAEFEAEYQKDGNAAKQKYQRKIIELTGVVVSGGRQPIRRLDGLKIGNVGCFTRNEIPWTKAAPGQSVKLRGKGDTTATPNLTDCEIIEVAGAPPSKITVEEFAKECKTNFKAAKMKYANKFLLISGEIEEIKPEDIADTEIIFKTPMSKSRISIKFERSFASFTMTLMKGQQFTAMGKFPDPVFVTEDQVTLEDGLPLK